MRHVDDGTLHAWLDGEVTDRTSATWLEEHLRQCADCAARLAEARATIHQADALLAGAAPADGRPGFDEIVQRAGGSTRPAARRARWLIPATWAASVALAAALGWTARDAATDVRREDVTSLAQAPASPAAPDNADGANSAIRFSDSAGAPPERGTASSARDAGTTAPASGSAGEAAARPAATQPAATQPETPAAAAPPARQALKPEPREPSSEQARAAPPTVTVTGAARLEPALEIATAQARGGLASVPGAPADTAARGSMRVVSGATAGAGPIAAAPAVAGGRITYDLAARPRAWRTVSRTEAAALTRMPLYGIAGLTPALTAVDAPAAAVRTVYQLPSGSSVELVQEPSSTETPGLLFTSPTQALAAAGTTRAEAGPAPASQWSGVRGNARVTLRVISGAEDVTELSTRLVLD